MPRHDSMALMGDTLADWPVSELPISAHRDGSEALIRENALLRKEIRVAREAAEITASLVVKQFEETEKVLRRFQRANAQRKAVLDSAARISIIATDTSGLITTFNTGAENLLGYRAEDVIGRMTPDMFLLETVLNTRGQQLSSEYGRPITGAMDVLLQYAHQDSSEQLEWIFLCKDGTRLPVEMTINALRDPEGRVSGMLCIASDISERKRAESVLKEAHDQLERRVRQRTAELARANQELQAEIRERRQAETALRASEEKYRSIFENAAEGIFQSTPAGRLVMANPAMAKMLGYETPEGLIEGISDLRRQLYVNPRDRDGFRRQISQDGLVKNFETRWYRKNGDVIHVSLNAHMVADAQGDAAYYEGMFEDITQRKRTEELKIAKEAAEAATRAKSDFLANMSHEIRTPMNAIINLTELAIKTDLSPKQLDYLKKIHVSSHALLGIINDILDFSKIEAGRLELEHADFTMDEVIDTISNMFAVPVAEKGIEMLINVDGEVPRRLVGDSLRLSQILINLINNAVKFTEEGEVVIRISTLTREADRVRLRFMVADSGIGINKEYLPHLFTSFSQADTSTTRKYGGTGLGLTICRQLVMMMDGEIWAESEPESGSRFTFTARFGLPEGWETAETGSLGMLEKLRILIVDNNAVARDIYHDILVSHAYRVDAVDSGMAAIRSLKENAATDAYDVVLLDWSMPGMDGITTVKKIRSIPGGRSIPIIMMTAYAREEVMQRAKEAGADGFLIKPFPQSMLFDTLTTCVDRLKRQAAGTGRPVPAASPEEKRFNQLQGASVLLVEDNAINQQVATEILSGSGITVDLADNGRHAVDRYREGGYDAILMDVQMPEMDGYEATRTIRDLEETTQPGRERRASVPIIAMTAHAMKGDREKCLAAGMDDYVTKPIDSRQLLKVLARWIRSDGEKQPGTARQPAADTEALGGAEELPARLEGIDVAAGLRRLNSPGLYRKLLLQFARNHQGSLEEICTCLEGGHSDSALKLLHGIKGVAGNLSAIRLYDAAQALEKAVAHGAGHTDQLARFRSAFDGTLGMIATLAAPAPESAERGDAKPELAHAAVVVSDLADHLRRNNMEAESCFQDLHRLLSGSAFAKRMVDIEADITSLDFETALKKLEPLMTDLGVS